jgi:hypothetical protein
MDIPGCRSADVRSVCLAACRDHSNHDGKSRDLAGGSFGKISDTIECINKDVFAHPAPFGTMKARMGATHFLGKLSLSGLWRVQQHEY